MANPGRIVAEIGKALGKAVIAGVGLELARVATKAVKARFGGGDDDDERAAAERNAPPRTATNASKGGTDAHDDSEALRRENAALREELGALRRDLQAQRKKP